MEPKLSNDLDTSGEKILDIPQNVTSEGLDPLDSLINSKESKPDEVTTSTDLFGVRNAPEPKGGMFGGPNPFQNLS